MRQLRFLILLFAWLPTFAAAQQIITEDTRDNHFGSQSDSIETEDVPFGIYSWTIDERFGTIRPTAYDTASHLFQNEAFTDGLTGRYSFLGNLGSPRLSRIFFDHDFSTFNGQFIFAAPYDFFLRTPGQLLYTNTKSPFTNLTYHECGNKQHGEDRFRALFSTNVNKQLGLGFKIDYLYGRGYYDSQSVSQFNGTFFGSYLGERYALHAQYYANHLKTSENGGIESDTYVNNPESFPSKYSPEDIPTNISKTYNKMNVNTLYLTQRYSLGFTRYRDESGKVVRIKQDKGASKFAAIAPDTLRADTLAHDSLRIERLHTENARPDSAAADSVRLIPEFVPTTGFIHTLRIDHNNRRFISNDPNYGTTYFNDFFFDADSANDFTRYLRIENQLAIELHEGLNKWLKMGARVFARHEFYRFSLPEFDDAGGLARKSYTENYISVGGQLLKEKGKAFHYHVLGELRTSGSNWGDFNVEGDADTQFPLFGDTLRVNIDGYVRRETPNFYLRHYHARNAWWDNDFDAQFSARVGGTVRWKETSLSFYIQNFQKFVYLQETQAPYTNSSGMETAYFGVAPVQKQGSLQLMGLVARQNFAWGIFHWENELAFQLTSDKDAYPLPLFNAWTNLFVRFDIAKVLHTELGADMRFFTKYYAPTYSPIIGLYAVQDADNRIEIGNYPTINVYANFHLKRTRFYVMASHVNYSSGSGNPFLVPHYPLNRLILRLGLSWNFIN